MSDQERFENEKIFWTSVQKNYAARYKDRLPDYSSDLRSWVLPEQLQRIEVMLSGI